MNVRRRVTETVEDFVSQSPSFAIAIRDRRDAPVDHRHRFGHTNGGASPKRRCRSGPPQPPASRSQRQRETT
jgi:hypothetical protein